MSFILFPHSNHLPDSLATLRKLGISPNLVKIYTFGSPRMGDDDFAEFMSRTFPCTFRCYVDGDVVSGMPSTRMASTIHVLSGAIVYYYAPYMRARNQECD